MNGMKITNRTARVTETPNAVMTTLGSPSLTGTATLSLWRTEMRPGQSGPLHVFDQDQIWTVLAGEADINVAGTSHHLVSGDALSVPAGVPRQVTARTDLTCLVAGFGTAVATVPGTDRPAAIPPWIA